MLLPLVEIMRGLQVIRDNPFKHQVHTSRMHHFFYGFTLIEALMTLSLLALFFIPIGHMKFHKSELDMLMSFKVELYQNDVTCVENSLFIDGMSQGFYCENLEGGLKIMYKENVIYYVKP